MMLLLITKYYWKLSFQIDYFSKSLVEGDPTHCDLVMQIASWNLVDIDWGNGMWPIWHHAMALHEQMVAYYQLDTKEEI